MQYCRLKSVIYYMPPELMGLSLLNTKIDSAQLVEIQYKKFLSSEKIDIDEGFPSVFDKI